MRVERLEHAGDGAIDQPVGRGLAHVIFFDGLQCGGKDLVLVWNLVLGHQRRPAKKAPHHGRDRDDGAGCRQ